MSSTITTFKMHHIDPTEPKKEDIDIEDIAHALSFMTRANGHFPEFYSVAQHCIHCAEEALEAKCSIHVALACLLHDASEAYLADITRPVKAHLPEYLVIEEVLQNVIYEKYLDSLLTEEEQKEVKRIDDTLLYYEFRHYMGECFQEVPPRIVSQPRFETKPFHEVEEKYKRLAEELAKKLNK